MKPANQVVVRLSLLAAVLAAGAAAQPAWKPNTDWAHWRLGHRSDPEFLKKNNFTVTFGPGAPLFEQATRQQFDEGMQKAREFNRSYHEKGYIVLRYLTTAVNGLTDSEKDAPRKDQTHLYRFYRERWTEFEDYLGPLPKADPTQWLMVRPDGTYRFFRYAPYGQKPSRSFEVWGCPNNPDYRSFMEAKLRATAESGIDGSYIDWTYMSTGTCYCEHCRRNFTAYLEEHLPRQVAKAKYGVTGYQDVRAPEKREDPFWMEWLTFRCHTVAEFHKRVRGVARKYSPHFLLAGNVNDAGFALVARDRAGNMEMLLRDGYDDFAYTEMQHRLESAPRKNEQGVKITNSPPLKYLAAAAHGKPAIIYATEITPPIFPNPTEKCLSAMAQINIAEAVANQCIFREKRETPPGATEIYGFLAANEEKLLGTRLRSNVAVLASIHQFLAGELSFALSTSRVLADRGIAHVVMVEDDLLAPDLQDYDLIVAPYLPLLSTTKQRALVRYVERGGSLVILGRSGMKDQHNLPLAEAPLAALVGKAGYPDQEVSRKWKKGRVEFVPLPIPPSRYRAHLKSDLFADVPEAYVSNRIDPALRPILEAVCDRIAQMLPRRLTRLAAGTPYLEITSMLARNKDRMLIHLVNYDVTLDGDITPARNVKVEVAVPEGKKVSGIEYSGSLASLRPVAFQPCRGAAGRCVQFEADHVGIYGLAVLQLQ